MISFQDIQNFSAGKLLWKNEDRFFFDSKNIILADGATDKSGNVYFGKTGWEIISQYVVDIASSSSKNGNELIKDIHTSIWKMYEEYGIDIHVRANLFSTTLVVCRICNDTLFITQVGDSSFRINGSRVYTYGMIIDRVSACLRRNFLLEFGVQMNEESRQFILPVLEKQHEFQNQEPQNMTQEILWSLFENIRENFADFQTNSSACERIFEKSQRDLQDCLGQDISYGVIDGTSTPEQYVHTYTFPLSDIDSLEVFSDGYFQIPIWKKIEDWEYTFAEWERKDPYKYLLYPSTKSKDDRTIIIANG